MASILDAIKIQFQEMAVSNKKELAEQLKVDTISVQIMHDGIRLSFTGEPKKLDTLMSQPNEVQVGNKQRKTKNGISNVRGYRQKKPKASLDQLVTANEADETNSQKTDDCISEWVDTQLRKSLGNIQSAEL